MQLMIRTLLTGLLVLAGVSAMAFSLGKYEKVKPTADAVSIPVARVADGKAHFYRWEDGGRAIAFFVVKGTDGSIRTAFDACDACYREKKGYEQQGEKMNCKNCNMKFAINRIGPIASGGCNPGYLPSQVSGGNIVIKLSDLRAGAKYF